MADRHFTLGNRRPCYSLVVRVSLQSPSRWPLLPVWVHLPKCDRLSCQKMRRFFASLLFLQTERTSIEKNIYKGRPPREVLLFFCAVSPCASVKLQLSGTSASNRRIPFTLLTLSCACLYIYICMHRCTADWKEKNDVAFLPISLMLLAGLPLFEVFVGHPSLAVQLIVCRWTSGGKGGVFSVGSSQVDVDASPVILSYLYRTMSHRAGRVLDEPHAASVNPVVLWSRLRCTLSLCIANH